MTITNNFNAPIGQHIDHVDTINFTMDGEGNFHFGVVESVNQSPFDEERLVAIVRECQGCFWGNASYAVLYCVMRDEEGYRGSAAQFERMVEEQDYDFERDFTCPQGTIANAFRHNPYMQKPVSRWRELGAKERVISLVERVRRAKAT